MGALGAAALLIVGAAPASDAGQQASAHAGDGLTQTFGGCVADADAEPDGL